MHKIIAFWATKLVMDEIIAFVRDKWNLTKIIAFADIIALHDIRGFVVFVIHNYL